jgi:aminomethyltransferase
MTQAQKSDPLLRTPLYALHVARGPRMLPFAGYDMPLQYPTGILAEHLHTRTAAGLFDVSHMGQLSVIGRDHQTAANALEGLVPADIVGLKAGQQRYTQLLNEHGGIIDDLIVTRPADPAQDGQLDLVVNASRKDRDYTHLADRLPKTVEVRPADDRALLALQGPQAAAVLARHALQIAAMPFMTAVAVMIGVIPTRVSRSGYTGEDGFEISVAAADAVALAETLLDEPEVKPIGLGARDSLRLEAGLCLYGHDIDETTSPVEAALSWSIQRRRRESGGFLGAARIQRELREGPSRLRVGLVPEGRAPVREGAEIKDEDGSRAGSITSGGFGPTVNGPIAMGYVDRGHAKAGTPISVSLRGRDIRAKIVLLPFVPHRYHR